MAQPPKKDPGQMTIKERRDYVNLLERERDVQDEIIDKELAKLATMRKGSDMYKKQLAYVNSLQDKWSSLSRTINDYNTELDKGAAKVQKASDDIQSLSDSLQKATDKVPILGEYLSKGVQTATDKAKKAIDNWIKDSDDNVRRRWKKTGLVLGGLLLGAAVAALAGFLKLLGKAKDEMLASSTSLTEVGRQLQMSKQQVKEIGEGVGRWQHYGAPWAGAIAQIKDDMGFIPKLTADENKLVAKLAANAGMSAEHIGSMYRHSQKLGMSLTDYTTQQALKIQNLNLEMGLHTTQAEVVAEIASASDETLAMFGKQNMELEKQVLIGKKIGLNLNQQASIAKSLLDIESSIEKEMEARVLLGKDLNFDKARELALQGDIGGAAEEVMAQVGGINEFQELNIVQKEALAAAAGMEVGQLQKALEKQAGIADQVDTTATDLTGATGNTSVQEGRDAQESRWGKLFGPMAEAFEKIKKHLNSKLLDWFETGGGKDALDWLNKKAESLAKWITGKGEDSMSGQLKKLRDKFQALKDWWANSAIGKFFAEHGGSILKALGIGATVAVAWKGTKKALQWVGVFPKDADGKSEKSAFWVRVVGALGLGSVLDSLSDNVLNNNNLLKDKNKSPSKLKQKLHKKWKGSSIGKKFRNIKASVLKTKRKITAPFRNLKSKFSNIKKGLFSKAKNVTKGIWGKVSGWGKKAWGGLKKVGGKAWSGIKSMNPIAKLKTAVKGNAGKFLGKAAKMGGKFAKGGIIGALMNAAALGSILFNNKLTPEEKAKKIIPVGASILGAGLGAVAGSIVPVVGTFGGSILGSFIGDWIGKIPAIQNALAPPLAKLLGGAEATEVEDFILSDKGLIKFRKDDLVIGGTKLNEGLKTGDNEKLDEIANLLKELIKVSTKDRVMSVDGKELATALAATQNYRGIQ